MYGFGHGQVGVGIEGGAIHQQRVQVGEVAAGGGQHGQAPGVDVAPVGHLAALHPRCGQPTEIQPGPEDGDGVWQRLGQLVQAALVLNQQDVFGGQRGGGQLGGGHALAGKGQQAGGQRGHQQPVLALGAATQKRGQPLGAGFAVIAHIQQGRQQAGVALEKLAVIARQCQGAQGFALGATGFQLLGHAGGGDDLICRHAPPQGQPAQQQAVKRGIHLAQHGVECLVVGLRSSPRAAAPAGDGGHAV